MDKNKSVSNLSLHSKSNNQSINSYKSESKLNIASSSPRNTKATSGFVSSPRNPKEMTGVSPKNLTTDIKSLTKNTDSIKKTNSNKIPETNLSKDTKSKYATVNTPITMKIFDNQEEDKLNKNDSLKISKSQFINSGNPHVITDLYHIGHPIKDGQNGTVRKAVHKLTSQPRAVKIIRRLDQDSNNFHNEVAILSKISHPNIIQIYEYFEDKTSYYIISEFCPGGELFDKISEKGMFSEKDAAYIVKQIVSALSYLHNNGIIHRDIKPENILLEDKSDTPIIKLIDFGLARYNTKKKGNKVSGSPFYISPEALGGDYDGKSDIWSVGIILYILLCGYPPFRGDNNFEIMKSVKKGKLVFPEEEWSSISDEAKDLIKKMLANKPKDRISAEICLTHKFFKKFESVLKRTPLIDTSITKMRQFTKNRKLEQATISYIVNQLMSKEERNLLLGQFKAWDKNGDGVLSKEEIFEGYSCLIGDVKAKEEADIIMETMDLDGNGVIDYNEFLAAAMNRKKVLSKKNLEATFKAFDLDGSGKISVDEISTFFIDPSNIEEKSKFEKILKDADCNGDGEVSLDEFIALMNKFI
jgi:calcium-dependent protein kinase